MSKDVQGKWKCHQWTVYLWLFICNEIHLKASNLCSPPCVRLVCLWPAFIVSAAQVGSSGTSIKDKDAKVIPYKEFYGCSVLSEMF